LSSHGSLALLLEAKLVDELVALRRVAQDLLDLVAERLLVAERALEGRERRAQIEELLELGDLVRDRLGLHVREAAELEVDVELAVLVLRELVLHGKVERKLLLAHHFVEVVLVDADGLPVLEW